MDFRNLIRQKKEEDDHKIMRERTMRAASGQPTGRPAWEMCTSTNKFVVRVQRLINLEVPALVRSLKSSNLDLSQYTWMGDCSSVS